MKATVFLNYNNITSSAANDLEITYNNIKNTIKEGYWTFSMLKSYGNGTCSITSDKIINLKNLGPILGFDKNQVINANMKTTSKNEVNINSSLEYIEITCSLVKMGNSMVVMTFLEKKKLSRI